MKYARPEEVGISSEKILEYVKLLEEKQLNTHSLIISKGDTIVFEKYWAPFHKDYGHRQYSVTKSFVALAIGFAEQEGLLNLDDPISKYFPKEMEKQHDENMRNQTIRHMLMMSTAKIAKRWFIARSDDRVMTYFDNDNLESRPSGTIFQYDSSGSFVLGALVERLTGKTLIQYLREKMFDKIGVSQEAHFLKCPGGHSWGDSALVCTSTDLWKSALFTMNKGNWNGEQLLNEKFVTDATSALIDNNVNGAVHCESLGYGYLIWRTWDNSFFFNGMGCQMAICTPDKDLVMVRNGDDQGNAPARNILIDNYFDMIVRTASDKPLPPNDAAYQKLMEETSDLKLAVEFGETQSTMADEINGVTFVMNENPMGITKMQLCFNGNDGVLKYTNAQGDKELPFGLGHNAFGLFPETGYSDQVGSQSAPGHQYQCAASAAWVEPTKLRIKVQIIDEYFGILHINMGFRDGLLGVYMVKSAEDFLDTYEGYAGGKPEK